MAWQARTLHSSFVDVMDGEDFSVLPFLSQQINARNNLSLTWTVRRPVQWIDNGAVFERRLLGFVEMTHRLVSTGACMAVSRSRSPHASLDRAWQWAFDQVSILHGRFALIRDDCSQHEILANEFIWSSCFLITPSVVVYICVRRRGEGHFPHGINYLRVLL